MWKLASMRTTKVTLKLAVEFDEMTAIGHERPLRESRLQVYERMVRAETFRPITWSSAFCAENGETYRVNGQHTARLFRSLVSEFADQVVTIERYDCDTLDDVGRLWSTFDSAESARRASEINAAFASTVDELKLVPRRVIDNCVMGMAGYKTAGVFQGPGYGTPPERAEALLEHTDFVMWVNLLLTGKDIGSKSQHLQRGGVVASMFGSWLKAKKPATEFWTAVRDETGAKPTCADRQLARWLLTTIVRPSTAGSVPRKKMADAREMFARCTYMWNAWRNGAEVKQIKYLPAVKIPAYQ